MSDSVRPHRWQPTRLPHPCHSPDKNTGVGCHFPLQCMKVKVKSLSYVRHLATPQTAAYQAPPSMGFSRQECWSGLPLPSPLFYLEGPRSTPGPADPGAPCWSRLHLAWWLLRGTGSCSEVSCCCVLLKLWLMHLPFFSRTAWAPPHSCWCCGPLSLVCNLTEVTFSGKSISQTLSPLLYPSVGDRNWSQP